MKDEPSFQRIRADLEARQKAILWEDARQGGKGVDAFLWKGDPKAKPVQRAGLLIFAIAFFFLAVIMASIPFQKDSENGGSAVCFLIALFCFLITTRLVRNAFLRSSRSGQNDVEDDDR
ncbi:MAG TPA: hypothetical protein VGG85_03930 [Terracidiphilus sp.]|jgi:hypothetical protein